MKLKNWKHEGWNDNYLEWKNTISGSSLTIHRDDDFDACGRVKGIWSMIQISNKINGKYKFRTLKQFNHGDLKILKEWTKKWMTKHPQGKIPKKILQKRIPLVTTYSKKKGGYVVKEWN